jgi:hypothetical protein
MRELSTVWVDGGHLFTSPMPGQVVLLDTGSLRSFGRIGESNYGGDTLVNEVSHNIRAKIQGIAGMDWFGNRFSIDLRSHQVGAVIRDLSFKKIDQPTMPWGSFTINGNSLECVIDTKTHNSFIRREFAPVRTADFRADGYGYHIDCLSEFQFEGWVLEVRNGHLVKPIKVGVLPEARERTLLSAKKSIKGIIGLEFIQGHVLSVNESVAINALELSGNAQFHLVRPFKQADMPEQSTAQYDAQHSLNFTMKPTGMDDSQRRAAIALFELIRCHLLLLKWYQRIPVRHKITFAPITSFVRIYDLVSVILKARVEDLEELPYKYYQKEFDEIGTPQVHLLELAHKIMGGITTESLESISKDHTSAQLIDEIRIKMQTIEIAYELRLF